MTPSHSSTHIVRRSPACDGGSFARKLAATTTLALALAPSIAHASYENGAWGFIVCLFLVPAALLAILVAAILRATGIFEKPAFALGFRWLIAIAAIAPALIVLSANDTVSTVMVLAVDAIALAAIFWLTRAPKSAKPQSNAAENIDQ